MKMVDVEMNLLKKIASLFSTSDDQGRVYWIYAQCDRCGEKLKTRVDLHNDLSINFGEGDEEDLYYTRKDIVGSGMCFAHIEATLTFDLNRRLIQKQMTGGKFITREEFEAE